MDPHVQGTQQFSSGDTLMDAALVWQEQIDRAFRRSARHARTTLPPPGTNRPAGPVPEPKPSE
jgi:hypothetical protein